MPISKISRGSIKVLFLAAEVDPLIKVGGLGDVAGSLPKAMLTLSPANLHGQHLDLRLAIPFHAGMNIDRWNPELAATFEIPAPCGMLKAQAYQIDLDGLTVYVIQAGPIGRPGPVYSMITQEDGEKFTVFSLAALELAKALNWQPDILHANDWHTAAAVYALALRKERDPFFAHTHSVLTLHNLPFMGAGVEEALEKYGLPASNDPRLPTWARQYPLPLGLLSADRIVAVSPSYAREILTPEFGCGLENFLLTRQDAIMGILNGLDQEVWDPRHDAALAAPYSDEDFSGKAVCRKALHEEFGLVEDPQEALLTVVSRMDQQKGIDLVVEGLRQSLDLPWKAIILGSGDPTLERACLQLQEEYPGRIRAAIRFDSRLSHRMYAGADLLLMPSRYEPCGLSQMIAMRYGTLPVASEVGGLKDTIQVRQGNREGTGFLFHPVSVPAFRKALEDALAAYQSRSRWKTMQTLAMRQDFSWARSALDYALLYLKLKG